MSQPAAVADHADLMDGVYRLQRHVYDATRKHYLLGRDRMIQGLDAPKGGTVLELGCGTGRNLIHAARSHPDVAWYGIDISSAMLATASRSIAKAALASPVRLAQGDACAFEASELFGRSHFDRVFLSYSLSMIPDWTSAIRAGLDVVAPGGALHVVDFGRQERHPAILRSVLRAWLARFHVEPRDRLREVLESEAQRLGATLSFDSLYGGYAVLARLRIPG